MYSTCTCIREVASLQIAWVILYTRSLSAVNERLNFHTGAKVNNNYTCAGRGEPGDKSR